MIFRLKCKFNEPIKSEYGELDLEIKGRYRQIKKIIDIMGEQ